MREKAKKYFVVSALAAGLGALVWWLATPVGPDAGYRVSVKVPNLSSLALSGKSAFDANCAACHGPNASGTDHGPPLVHDIYNPGHHADEAFYRAAQRGVRRHHWRYGDMPPQLQVSREQMAAVVRYVRELQVANGVTYRPHRM
jgi:mono/diheme cytochrome c family protein